MPDECELSRAALCNWLTDTSSGPLEVYLRTLALTSTYYEPTVANMDALIAELEQARFTPDPLEHER